MITVGCLIGSKVALTTFKKEVSELYKTVLQYISFGPRELRSRSPLTNFKIGDWLEEIIMFSMVDPRVISIVRLSAPSRPVKSVNSGRLTLLSWTWAQVCFTILTTMKTRTLHTSLDCVKSVE